MKGWMKRVTIKREEWRGWVNNRQEVRKSEDSVWGIYGEDAEKRESERKISSGGNKGRINVSRTRKVEERWGKGMGQDDVLSWPASEENLLRDLLELVVWKVEGKFSFSSTPPIVFFTTFLFFLFLGFVFTSLVFSLFLLDLYIRGFFSFPFTSFLNSCVVVVHFITAICLFTFFFFLPFPGFEASVSFHDVFCSYCGRLPRLPFHFTRFYIQLFFRYCCYFYIVCSLSFPSRFSSFVLALVPFLFLLSFLLFLIYLPVFHVVNSHLLTPSHFVSCWI